MIVGKYQKLGDRYGMDPPSEPTEGTSPADTLISDFQPQELWENKFLLFQGTQFAVIYYSGPEKLVRLAYNAAGL